MAARWASSFARWQTPHIYILRFVPSLTGARPLESQVMSYGCPALRKLGYVLPILTAARRPRWRTAHLTCKVISILTKAGRGGAGPRTTGNARGFCPHFWGFKFAHPFLNFRPGGIALGRTQRIPLLLTVSLGVSISPLHVLEGNFQWNEDFKKMKCNRRPASCRVLKRIKCKICL